MVRSRRIDREFGTDIDCDKRYECLDCGYTGEGAEFDCGDHIVWGVVGDHDVEYLTDTPCCPKCHSEDIAECEDKENKRTEEAKKNDDFYDDAYYVILKLNVNLLNNSSGTYNMEEIVDDSILE